MANFKLNEKPAKTTLVNADIALLGDSADLSGVDPKIKQVTFDNIANYMQSRLNFSGMNIKYLTSVDSPYTILDSDPYTTFVVDSSGGNVNITLPTRADNDEKSLEFIHQKGGNVLNVDGEGAEKINYLDSINMPQEGDRIKIYSSSVTFQWEFLDHNLEFYVKVSDEKTSGTDGGSFTAGAWRTRDINTENDDDQNICAISTNQITLSKGTYYCEIKTPAYLSRRHKSRLYNVTDAATLLLGSSEYSQDLASTSSIIKGRFTIDSTKDIEIQHQCQTSISGNGFGASSGFGVNEIYTIAALWRIT